MVFHCYCVCVATNYPAGQGLPAIFDLFHETNFGPLIPNSSCTEERIIGFHSNVFVLLDQMHAYTTIRASEARNSVAPAYALFNPLRSILAIFCCA